MQNRKRINCENKFPYNNQSANMCQKLFAQSDVLVCTGLFCFVHLCVCIICLADRATVQLDKETHTIEAHSQISCALSILSRFV